MIRHIVMWKFKEMAEGATKAENLRKVKGLLEAGEAPANIARFTLDTVTDVVLRATREAQARWPGLPVLCSGGVASNTRLREALAGECGALFAQPRFSTDNAMGTAILTWRALERERQP